MPTGCHFTQKLSDQPVNGGGALNGEGFVEGSWGWRTWYEHRMELDDNLQNMPSVFAFEHAPDCRAKQLSTACGSDLFDLYFLSEIGSPIERNNITRMHGCMEPTYLEESAGDIPIPILLPYTSPRKPQ